MVATAQEFIQKLSERHGVIVIGGLAVIAHGFNRPTKDADIWLEPMDSPSEWAATIQETCRCFSGLTIHTLPEWRMVSGPAVAEAAAEIGMVRIMGLDCPVDVFREPNEFAASSFADVLSRCTRNSDSTWLPDPIDLAISKDLTNRDKDAHDILFLESIARNRWIEILPSATREQAESLFARFVDWQTCQAAMSNPDQTVREMAIAYLREFAREGDPFSQAILDGREIPPP
ncbi:MAG: hypothetical protein ACKO2G_00915 [Verrucomicrobiales bacterium]